MDGYTKISVKTNSTAKSRSIDFSDLSFSPPKAPKYFSNTTYKTQLHEPVNSKIHDPFPVQEEEEGVGERFGVILSRNCSSASQRFRVCERTHSSTLQAVVRRAFSMRKPSSSLSDGYWRIHDTAEDNDGNGEVEQMQQQQQQQMRSSRKRRGKILKACKRLFGF